MQHSVAGGTLPHFPALSPATLRNAPVSRDTATEQVLTHPQTPALGPMDVEGKSLGLESESPEFQTSPCICPHVTCYHITISGGLGFPGWGDNNCPEDS
jgi:hypothetical protein